MATQFLRPVSSSRTPVSRERFHELVKTKAYELWESREVAGRMNDWNRACRDFGVAKIWLNDPLYPQVNERAGTIYNQRKDADAYSDWLEARHTIATIYWVYDMYM